MSNDEQEKVNKPKGSRSGKDFDIPLGPAADDVAQGDELYPSSESDEQLFVDPSQSDEAPQPVQSELAEDDAERLKLDDWITEGKEEQEAEAKQSAGKHSAQHSAGSSKKLKRFGIAAAAGVVVFAAVIIAAIFIVAFHPEGTPSQTVDSAMTAIKQGDTETLSQLSSDEANTLSADIETSLYKALDISDYSDVYKELNNSQKRVLDHFNQSLRDFDYQVTGEVIEGDKAYVTVMVYSHDFGTLFQNVISDYMSESLEKVFNGTAISDRNASLLFVELLEKYLPELGEKTVENQIVVILVMQDGNWKIQPFSNEDMNALTGGMYTLLETVTTAEIDENEEASDNEE